MLNTLQREYQLAHKITDKLWEEYLETENATKRKALREERKAWLYVGMELRDILKKFGVEVVS